MKLDNQALKRDRKKDEKTQKTYFVVVNGMFVSNNIRHLSVDVSTSL